MDNNESTGLHRSLSVESTASLYQSTDGRFTQSGPYSDNMVIQYGESAYDCAAMMLICSRHDRIALSELKSKKGIWFPHVPTKIGQGYSEAMNNYLKQLLTDKGQNDPRVNNSFKPPPAQLISILNIQMPIYLDFVKRMLFLVIIADDDERIEVCARNEGLIWVSFDSIDQIPSMWGPEPSICLSNYLNNTNTLDFYECSVKDLISYIQSDGARQQMIRMCGITEKEIINLYGEFMQHCFPSQYMNFYSFSQFVANHDLRLVSKDCHLTNIFRALAVTNKSHINFYELLVGMAAMDKKMVHGNRIGEIRVGYIFRYYNNSDSNSLNFGDLKLLMFDVMLAKQNPNGVADLEKELSNVYSIFGKTTRDPIPYKTFVKAVGNLQIRGTSLLFRAVEDRPLGTLLMKCGPNTVKLMEMKQDKQWAKNLKLQQLKGICMRCKDKRYTLAAHFVRVLTDGTAAEPQEIRGLSDVSRMSKVNRRLSDLAFYSNNICNILIDMIRTSMETPIQWFKSGKLDLVDKVLKLCSEVELLFASEPRVVKASSPIYVLGDIHGNLRDLLIYEKIFWSMGPACLSCNYLFLGDYVDRGSYSVECIVYLLCCKLLSPSRFLLIRGNHELRSVQQQFTFYRECMVKFGKSGNKVWEAMNKAFDCMPISAIIDEQIFCAHGGIPASTNKLDAILQIPNPMSQPEYTQCAWEILWNDPITSCEFDAITTQRMAGRDLYGIECPPGFLPNSRRGTAFYFGDEAVNAFLTENGFSHVIRAHEAIPTGFQFHCNGRVITVFSSSHYCNTLNEAAVILVDNNKIRVLKVDTSF